MSPPYKRAGRLLLGLFLAHALLVLTHVGDFWPQERRHELGEFWPFSIYPMFSQGGKPWVRSLVREVDAADPSLWRVYSLADLPGQTYALNDVGVLQNDISNSISKTRVWNAQRIAGMRKVFGNELDHKHLLILRADGAIQPDSVSVTFTPFLLFAPDSTYFNPNLEYVRE